MIPRSHPLASVRGAYNAVFVESEAAGQLMFYGPGAGGAPTASAVLGDLVTVARNRLAGTRGAGESAYADRAVQPMGETRTRYHVAIDVDDRAGVLAAVANAFADHDVSIQTVRQEGRGADAQLVVVSHAAPDAALSATVEAAAQHGHRPRGHLGDARRGGRRVSMTTAVATRQWRGVIEEYRDLLDLPEGLEAVTLREGGTPLVHSEWLSGADRRRGVAQGRGQQPDRLVQGPRHDRGHLGGQARGRRRPWSAPRPATPPPRWRPTPPRPASSRSC